MPPDPPTSSRLTALTKDALGVFQYLSAYFSNSAIYSISYWKPCDTELNKWLERHKKNLLLDAPQGHEDEDD